MTTTRQSVSFAPSVAAPRPCAGCGSKRLRPFFSLPSVPGRPSVLAVSHEEALSCPRGDILLVYCRDCGFVGNQQFDPALPEYSPRTEDTQAYSETFSQYQQELTRHIIEELGIRGRHVIEIGCGKGEFLARLCRMGGNRGTGFDPAFRADRHPCPGNDQVRFIADRYSDTHAGLNADLYYSKMTLEHIAEVGEFLGMLRCNMDGARTPLALFQVPNAAATFREARFHDIVYEHCSYFDAQSLQGLFRRAGFKVLNTRVTYGGQHVSVEARPARGAVSMNKPALLRPDIERFAARGEQRVREWSARLEAAAAGGKRIVVWGSSSRTTTFLNLVDATGTIERVVDINPHRQGTYIPGTGHPIIAPVSLRENPPDIVIVINANYLEEIRRTLTGLGLAPEIVAV